MFDPPDRYNPFIDTNSSVSTNYKRTVRIEHSMSGTLMDHHLSLCFPTLANIGYFPLFFFTQYNPNGPCNPTMYDGTLTEVVKPLYSLKSVILQWVYPDILPPLHRYVYATLKKTNS